MRILTVSMALAGLLLAGCGGGGGGGGTDLNGWWEFSLRSPGPTDPYQPALVGPATHSGQDVRYLGLEWTFDGTHLAGADPDFTTPSRQEFHIFARSQDLLEGEMISYVGGDPPPRRDILMLRVPPPSGTASATGNLGGGPLAWSCSTAYARVEETPTSGSDTDYYVEIIDTGPSEATSLRLQFTLAEFLVFPATKNVIEAASVQYTSGDDAWAATDGELVIEEFILGGRIQGTFQVVFGLDGAATGAFDAPVLVVN